MKTRAFREYILGPSMNTLEIRRNIAIMQRFSGGDNGNRKRKMTCGDIACKLASIVLYAGCAVSLVMLVKTAIG